MYKEKDKSPVANGWLVRRISPNHGCFFLHRLIFTTTETQIKLNTGVKLVTVCCFLLILLPTRCFFCPNSREEAHSDWGQQLTAGSGNPPFSNSCNCEGTSQEFLHQNREQTDHFTWSLHSSTATDGKRSSHMTKKTSSDARLRAPCIVVKLAGYSGVHVQWWMSEWTGF